MNAITKLPLALAIGIITAARRTGDGRDLDVCVLRWQPLERELAADHGDGAQLAADGRRNRGCG